jgi:hypothetical protein
LVGEITTQATVNEGNETLNPDGTIKSIVLDEPMMLAESQIGIQADIPADTVISLGDDSITAASFASLDVTNTSNDRIASELGETVTEAFDFGIVGEDIVFSKAVKISVPVDLADGSVVELGVKHE